MTVISFPVDTSHEVLDKLDREGLTTLYAALHVMESKIWKFADKHDAFDDPNIKARQSSIDNAQADIIRMYFSKHRNVCYVVAFRGCLTCAAPRNLSHHDIDKDLEKTFGRENVCADSESGGLFVDTTENVADLVKAYLMDRYPHLEFEMVICDGENDSLASYHQSPPEIGEWSSAEKWLKDRGISVSIEMPDIYPKSGKELEDLLNTARRSLIKTGLSMDHALELLRDRL